MSSHHFVVENQEPALIIANGEACSLALLHGLLEWNPLVIVLDSAMERVQQLNIKVDVIIGDFDRNYDAEKFKNMQYPIEIIHNRNQNSTDLEKAYHYLLSKNIKMVNVVWATGKRMDHTMGNIYSIVKYGEQLKIVFYDDYSKIFLLPKSFSKWYKKNQIISLIPIINTENITTKNLVYSLNNESLDPENRLGTSNAVKEDGLVNISYKKGKLLLIESND